MRVGQSIRHQVVSVSATVVLPGYILALQMKLYPPAYKHLC